MFEFVIGKVKYLAFYTLLFALAFLCIPKPVEAGPLVKTAKASAAAVKKVGKATKLVFNVFKRRSGHGCGCSSHVEYHACNCH